MAGILLPAWRGWTRQPSGPVEIDWSNPITRGLEVVVTPGSAFAVAPEVAPGRDALALRKGVLARPPVRAGVANATILCVDHYIGQDASGNLWQSGDAVYADTAAPWPGRYGLMLISARSYAQVNLSAYDTGNNARSVSIAVGQGQGFAAGSGAILVRAVTVDADLLVRAYGNGIFIGGSTALQGFTYPIPAAGAAGPLAGTTGATDTVTYQSIILRWSRRLSDAEIRSVSDNPWRVFAPIQRGPWLVGAAGSEVHALNLFASAAASSAIAKTLKPSRAAVVSESASRRALSNGTRNATSSTQALSSRGVLAGRGAGAASKAFWAKSIKAIRDSSIAIAGSANRAAARVFGAVSKVMGLLDTPRLSNPRELVLSATISSGAAPSRGVNAARNVAARTVPALGKTIQANRDTLTAMTAAVQRTKAKIMTLSASLGSSVKRVVSIGVARAARSAASAGIVRRAVKAVSAKAASAANLLADRLSGLRQLTLRAAVGAVASMRRHIRTDRGAGRTLDARAEKGVFARRAASVAISADVAVTLLKKLFERVLSAASGTSATVRRGAETARAVTTKGIAGIGKAIDVSRFAVSWVAARIVRGGQLVASVGYQIVLKARDWGVVPRKRNWTIRR